MKSKVEEMKKKIPDSEMSEKESQQGKKQMYLLFFPLTFESINWQEEI